VDEKMRHGKSPSKSHSYRIGGLDSSRPVGEKDIYSVSHTKLTEAQSTRSIYSNFITRRRGGAEKKQKNFIFSPWPPCLRGLSVRDFEENMLTNNILRRNS
jgi:hypothetical protein